MTDLPDPLMPTLANTPAPQPVLGQRDHRALPWPLHQATSARALEAAAAAGLPPHALMRRAGLGVARLALALAPHARNVWIMAGPGNNGGDGFEAALHLQRWLRPHGVQVQLNVVCDAAGLPPDAAASLARAQAAGVVPTPGSTAPPGLGARDIVIDGLLGRGLSRPATGVVAEAIAQINGCGAPALAIDLPSGLPGDTGALTRGAPCVGARWTLALLSLPPGMFTAQGRDACGDIWWDHLGVASALPAPDAWLASNPALAQAWPARRHAQHKGSFGDLWVVGGAAGMGGAARLAGRSALFAGAGRVYLAAFDPAARHDGQHPELMGADPATLARMPERLAQGTVVAGCGGGQMVGDAMPPLVAEAARLLVDADALNALAAHPEWQLALRQRASRGRATVLTPHPLEAARLLGCSAQEVQADRLAAARQLAEDWQATVVLKGSGTVVATPGQAPWIHPVGNAALSSPGTGDVLAGWLGGLWSQLAHLPPQDAAWLAARSAVWQHGRCAERLRPDGRGLCRPPRWQRPC
jgi:hydroxyethylthiazole kinase-like uncharacterized protein yjeF